MNDIQIVTPSAIEQISRAEIDIQVATAKRYPRNPAEVKKEIVAMATSSQEVAQSCKYRITRAGKAIEGESIRLAEICIHAFGNLRVQARIVDDQEKFVTAQGIVHDLEKNVAVAKETRVRTTDKHGKPYGEDMRMTACNAAIGKAIRDAVFRVIPKALLTDILPKIEEKAVGKGQPIVDRFHKCCEKFKAFGVTEAQILRKIERKHATSVTEEDIRALIETYQGIHDGETKVEDEFPAPEANDHPASKEHIEAFWSKSKKNGLEAWIESKYKSEVKEGVALARLGEIMKEAEAANPKEKKEESTPPDKTKTESAPPKNDEPDEQEETMADIVMKAATPPAKKTETKEFD